MERSKEFQTILLIHKLSRYILDYTGGHSAQDRVLVILSHIGSMPQKDLQLRLDIASSSMTEILEKLENAHYIYRYRSDEDKRVVVVEITPEGKNKAIQLKSELDKKHTELFQHMSKEELDELHLKLHELYTYWKGDKDDKDTIKKCKRV